MINEPVTEWNAKFLDVVEARQKLAALHGTKQIPVVVLLGPKSCGKSFLANSLSKTLVLPFNHYFQKAAYAIHPCGQFINKEEAFIEEAPVLGTYRDFLINIGNAMEQMKGMVIFTYYQLLVANTGYKVIVNDSVRRQWEVDFFVWLGNNGWPVAFVEVTSLDTQYGTGHKTEDNYAQKLRDAGIPVVGFDNRKNTHSLDRFQSCVDKLFTK